MIGLVCVNFCSFFFPLPFWCKRKSRSLTVSQAWTLPQHLRSVVVEQSEGREEVVVQGDAAISARVEELQALVTDMQEGIKSLPQNLRSIVVEQSEGKEGIPVKDDAVINLRVEELQVQVAGMSQQFPALVRCLM